MKRAIIIIGYLVIILAAIFLFFDYQAGKIVSAEVGLKSFTIVSGQGLKEIANNLEKDGFIKDKTTFMVYTFLRNLRKNFLPGEYEIRKNISIKELLNILTVEMPSDRKITLIEGWNNQQVAVYLQKLRLFSQDIFLKTTEDPSQFKERFNFLDNPKIKSLEGFIFPDTYKVRLKSDPQEIISKALENFDQKIDENLRREISKQKKSLYDILILASIVEKEAIGQNDREIIAGIFWKRLRNNIGLQADSTINYITGKSMAQASASDLKINSLYNTYKYRGLPPGPICNPSLESIKAVIYYQDSPYFYFLHAPDGQTIYSKTFEEHKRNKNKYLNQNNSKQKELLVKYQDDNQIYKIKVDAKADLNKIKKDYLVQDKKIEKIEPNYTFQATVLPNDPHYSEQWYLNKLNSDATWNITRGEQDSVIIALLDSGVYINHPDLKDNIWKNEDEIPNDGIDNDHNGQIDDLYGWDFINNLADPNPKFYPDYTVAGMNHGTVVAGIMAAKGNNNLGISGLVWNTQIMPVRVLNNRGEGTLEAVIKGIDYAIKNKADIINLSFVGPNSSELLFDAVKRAWDNNILIVAAAGNNSGVGGDNLDKKPLYPVCLDANYKENIIIGVTAVDQADKKSTYANYGRGCVDISAPGAHMYSTLFYYPQKSNFKDYYGGYWSGTSMATPLVSATAALIKSLNPLISNRELRNILLETVASVNAANSETGWQDKIGAGRLNTLAAVETIYNKLTNIPHRQYIVTATHRGSEPLIKILQPTGIEYTKFYAYAKSFKGGVSLATGDLDGDGVKEIITGAGQGGGPQVRIFDEAGNVKNQFFAYDKKLRDGIVVASGDVNGDNRDEIIVGSETTNLPIKIFDFNGRELSFFYAYAKSFKGGVSLATGDLDGDGVKEIITGAGQGGGPQVRIFEMNGKVKGQFFAFNEQFRGGINVSAGDTDLNGLDEVVVSVASNANPYVRIFNSSFYLLAQFLAYDKNFFGGVSLALDDVNGDNRLDIITAPNGRGGSQIRFFDVKGEAKNQFFAYDKNFKTGLGVATIKKFKE